MNNLYFYYLLHQVDRSKIVTGTAQPQVTIENLSQALIPLPPLAEQQRIVDKIETAFALIDSIDFETVLEDISAFRKEILNRAFRGELTEQDNSDGTGQELLTSIQLKREQQEAGMKGKKKTELPPVEAGEEPYDLPENWVWTRLGEATNYGQAKRWNGEDSKYEYLIDLEDVEKNTSRLLRKRRIEDVDIRGEKTTFEPGDVVYSKLRPYLNKVFIPDFHGTCSTEMIPIKSKVFNNTFLLHLLKDNRFLSYAENLSFGTKMPRLSTSSVLVYEVPLPPLAEQHRIVEKIEAIFATLDTMEQAILLQKAEASTCYEEILRKILEGK
jgi:type I restriction enzyme S subunit